MEKEEYERINDISIVKMKNSKHKYHQTAEFTFQLGIIRIEHTITFPIFCNFLANHLNLDSSFEAQYYFPNGKKSRNMLDPQLEKKRENFHTLFSN